VVLLCLIPHLLIGNTVQNERSGLWVVRYAITTKAEIDRVLSTAIDLNITDIFFQIRALGYTYYNSQLEIKAESIEGDFDPLQYVIAKSAGSGIRIHAWINMFYVWAGDQFPLNTNHIINKHRRYVLRNDDFPKYLTLKQDGHEGFFLDPRVNIVQNELLGLIQEIAGAYDIAGIHLDYYRYPSLSYSFTPASRTQHMLTNIYDPWDIYESSQEYSKKRGFEVFLHADREYRKSLIGTLSRYLKTISDEMKHIKADLQLSVAVKPDPVEAKHRYFQDWLGWLKDNICDFVVLMNYRTKMSEFNAVLNQLREPKIKEKIIVGISTYNQEVKDVLKRLDATRKGEFSGFSLFSYNHLIENKSYLETLQRKIFAWR
jgi:uncharacterized lipoprotein YddW (UPF0748 family)